jgi:hypothetical protein
MAIMREFDEKTGTVVLKYGGQPITPELNPNDPKQILEVLTEVINNAYNKMRDAGLI